MIKKRIYMMDWT